MTTSFQDVRVGFGNNFLIPRPDGSISVSIGAVTPGQAGHFSCAITDVNTWTRFLACMPIPGMQKWTLKVREPVAVPFDYSFISAPRLSWMSVGAGQVVSRQMEFSDLYVRCNVLTVLDIELCYNLTSSLDVPVIWNITPSNVMAGTASFVTITGENFDTAMQIDLGTGITIADFARVSNTQIDANIIVGAGALPGPRDVVVRNLAGEGTGHNLFTVTPSRLPTPIITVTEPNGGEIWTIGSRRFVRWTTMNLAGLVAIYLSRDSGASYALVFDNVPHDAGQVEIPRILGPATTAAKVMVRSKSDLTVLDISDNVFEIQAVIGPPEVGVNWVFNEVPPGTLDGINRVFTLSSAPSLPAGLHLFKNGQLQTRGTDYVLDGRVVTFSPGRVPQANDVLLATYPRSGIVGNWIFNETPSGPIDGVNRIFTLSRAPNPPNGLFLFKNGQLQTQGVDYVLNGAVITFSLERIPQHNDVILATYPY